MITLHELQPLLIRKPCLFSLLLLGASLLLAAQQATPGHPNEIAFMTDFGLLDDSVAICEQVMYNIDPAVKILDISHAVTPFSILYGARYLDGMSGYVPQGTVFVAVIDPTVGTSRKAFVAKSRNGNYYVLPDNGLLTYLRLVMTRAASMPSRFCTVGAHLARGENWIEVGPEMPVSSLVLLPLNQSSIANGVLRDKSSAPTAAWQSHHQRQPRRIRPAGLQLRRHAAPHAGRARIRPAGCEDLR